ncbi:Hypothetical_protein [Hexamita inflata]|uniref:Hypothetical_protein n=1 Tax=Hexamita inflata TaxID=28002 RepID=A0AA86QVT6_9EUKA|nr:Hypothetical protein HINF_LOCUS47919 [Hexamita inflata]
MHQIQRRRGGVVQTLFIIIYSHLHNLYSEFYAKSINIFLVIAESQNWTILTINKPKNSYRPVFIKRYPYQLQQMYQERIQSLQFALFELVKYGSVIFNILFIKKIGGLYRVQ